MKKICLVVLIVCFIAVVAVGCTVSGGSAASLHFGQFGYKGRMLPEYAVKTITAFEAKELIGLDFTSSYSATYCAVGDAVAQPYVVPASITSEQQIDPELPPAAAVETVLRDYAGCVVTTKYYVEGSDKVQSKEDTLIGTDFKNMLEINQFVPFNQLVAKNVIIFDGLIEYMEGQNELFANSPTALIAPFRSIFSYHTDKSGNLVVQTRDFAEIPSSVGGGIGCSYRQDTEIVYDAEGKMTLWQTSLGLYSSSPQGTMQDGYILELQVDWIEKV